MSLFVYRFGRVLQALSLAALPCAIWAGEVRHSEAESIGILVGSVLLFGLGWLACRLAMPR